MAILKELGGFIGKPCAGRAKRAYEKLEDALEHLFWWEEEFSVKAEGEAIVSSGACPVYDVYPKWCEEACMEFAEQIASAYGFGVERVRRRPEERICEFKYTK